MAGLVALSLPLARLGAHLRYPVDAGGGTKLPVQKFIRHLVGKQNQAAALCSVDCPNEGPKLAESKRGRGVCELFVFRTECVLYLLHTLTPSLPAASLCQAASAPPPLP